MVLWGAAMGCGGNSSDGSTENATSTGGVGGSVAGAGAGVAGRGASGGAQAAAGSAGTGGSAETGGVGGSAVAGGAAGRGGTGGAFFQQFTCAELEALTLEDLVVDDGGDGVTPGEQLNVSARLVNPGSESFDWYPSVKLSSSDSSLATVEQENNFVFFAILPGQSNEAYWVVNVSPAAASGASFTLTATVTTLGETDCANAATLNYELSVE